MNRSIVKTKYFILVPDGCGDHPIAALGGKTPLEAADIKNINELAKASEVGLARTVPTGMEPGSDVANLSILGFDPATCLTGRAPLEAVAMGIVMSDADTAFRANLITLDGEGVYENLTIKDHGAGDISSEEAATLIECIDKELGDRNVRFYPGVSYRCLMVTDKLGDNIKCTPPHDVISQKVGEYLPKGDSAETIKAMMRRSYEILKNHPINVKRVQKGLNPANSIWLWGQGKKPMLASFEDKFGISGSVITAVDLVRGIGTSAGLDIVKVPGATGNINTNYEGKAMGAIDEFKKGKGFVYLHVEAPDECSHNGDLDGKLKSLEFIDNRILKHVMEYLESTSEPYRVLIITDHYTLLKTRTHSSEPVPFVLFDSNKKQQLEAWKTFSEASGEKGSFFESGCKLADYFFQRENS